jgi:hypothetical protein
MAVIKKTLFPKNLDNYSVLVNDTDVDSKYFKITSLPDAFTGGKNAFLIAGSEYLVPDTKIQIELKDASGNIIYHEPGEGYISSSLNGVPFVTEYYEGISKVVSVYVYPDTAYGPCTLTILGELSSYNSDGITSIVPLDWENKYNVKWQRQINVDPSLANTTKIRFYQRPQVTITEILAPIYRIESGSKVDSGINQSFADIKLSNLETFAGDVKRVKVFRTSEGDISDYDLIQDILVESKELLTSYGLSGSVVGETGIFTAETLKNNWNTGSLNAFLTSSRVESGVRLTGSGYFTYTSSLDIKSTNTYELNLDAFYSSSSSSNLGVYLSQVTTSGDGITPTIVSSSIATLVGTQPTKNLLDTIIPFRINRDYPSAYLYFSQSQGEWHLGNISLRLSEDTAFSPDEISFVTTMPTVIGNETYNFKFEFYDVNNNYVPVAVTQSLNFTGGTIAGDANAIISASITASLSQSLAALTAVSSSISGTVTNNSASAFSTITNVSSSISSSIISLSGSVSSSINTLSGSIANELILTSGSVTLLSGSFLQFTQSVSSSLNSLSQSVSSSFLNAASQSAFQVYSASQYLDKFIFTDENGKINQTPTASSPGLYLGSDHLGYFSGSSWKTYMDNQGDFYLTGSTNNFLAWSSQLGTLQVQGVINIQGGNAATTSSLNSATSSLLGSINSATASLSSSLAPNIFTDSTGKINRPPTVLVNSSQGLFLGSTNLGYYSGSDWKTYMADNGNFYLSGAGSDSLTWAGGVLSINGAINITGGNAATTTNVSNAVTSGSLFASNAVTSGSNAATNAATSGSSAAARAVTSGSLFAANAAASASLSASAVDDKVFTNALGRITKAPTSGSTAGLYLGSTNLGYYNGGTWRTYMDNTGLFYLTGSNNGNALLWDGNILTIKGTIKVSDGSEVTSTTITKAGSALQNSDTGKSLGLTGGSVGGVTIASTKIYVGTGTHGNANTGFYVDSDGKMSLKDKLVWDGNDLSIIGNITVSAGPVAAAISNLNSTTSSLNSSVSQINTATGSLTTAVDGKITAGGAAADVNSNVTNISGGKIKTGTIESTGFAYTSGNFSTTGTQINLDNGLIRSKNFSITSAGDAFFKGDITGASGTFSGTLSGATITGGTINIGPNKFQVDSSGNSTIAGNLSLNTGGTVSIRGYKFYNGGSCTSPSVFLDPGGDFVFRDFDASGTILGFIRGFTTVTNCGIPGLETTSRTIVHSALNGFTFGQYGGSNWATLNGTELSVTGDVVANTSDKRLKKNIVNIDSPLEKLSKINGVYFNWNETAKELNQKNTNKREVGFIAQEVQEVMPEIISLAPFDTIEHTNQSKSGENYLTIQYEKMVPLLVECIKELKKEIEELKNNK